MSASTESSAFLAARRAHFTQLSDVHVMKFADQAISTGGHGDECVSLHSTLLAVQNRSLC